MSKSSNTYDAIFFSPHLDDVVLSCGNQIIQLNKKRKKVLVVTVFTNSQEVANKSQDLNTFLKQSGAVKSEQLFKLRRQEDLTVTKLIGFEFLHLGFIDALWRTANDQQLYPTFQKLFNAPIHANDRQLEKKISAVCFQLLKKSSTHKTLLYSPLAIGRHVDHRLIFEILTKLAKKINKKFTYYEDIPYRSQPGAREKRLAETNLNNGYFSVAADKNSANKKRLACEKYSSQIAGVKSAGLGTIDYYQEGFFRS